MPRCPPVKPRANFPSRGKSLVSGHTTLQAGPNQDGQGLDLAMGGIQPFQSSGRTDHTQCPHRTAMPVLARNQGQISKKRTRNTGRRWARGAKGTAARGARGTAARGAAARATAAREAAARGAVLRPAVARGGGSADQPPPDKYPLFPYRASFYTHS
ncbi:MAG: hypothetical protein GY696_19565 [Gammaproteobacteria bacterium]|nr:hypothetical protein [Gammaproteobacteria bacterium]